MGDEDTFPGQTETKVLFCGQLGGLFAIRNVKRSAVKVQQIWGKNGINYEGGEWVWPTARTAVVVDISRNPST